MRKSLKKVFLVHGETDSMESLSIKLRDELALEPVVPSIGSEFILE